MPRLARSQEPYGIKGWRPIPFVVLEARGDLFPDQEEAAKDPVYVHLRAFPKGIPGKTIEQIGMLIAKGTGINEYEVLGSIDQLIAVGIVSLERRYGYIPR